MKKLLFGIFIFLITTQISLSQNKGYQIPIIEINAEIKENGVVRLTEHRTYQFTGSFSWADYRLPKKGFTEIRNIRVHEGEQFFTNENSEVEGTFSVSESDESVIIKWFYEALDTSRTFSITYELSEAISVGPDWSEFFWNYIAAGREKPTEILRINISLPQEVSSDSLYAWLRASSNQTSIRKSSGTFTISAENLSTNQSVQVRALFPTSVFDRNEITVTDSDLTLERVQNDEKAYLQEQREKAERQAYLESITPEIILLISVISIAIFIFLYRKYGKRFSTGTISDRETILIPDSSPPAIIGRLLMSNTTTGRHLAATLFDLARRGWFIIQEEKKEKSGFFSSESSQFSIKKADNQPDEHLTEWEQMLIDHVNHQIEMGHHLFEEVFKKGDFKMSKWFPKWKKKIKAAFDEQKWMDKNSYKGVYINLTIQSVLLITSIALLIAGENEISLIGLGITVIMLVASFAILRRTADGQEKYVRWKAYQRGLKNADKRTIRMEMLDRHFIFAMAFHLSKKQIEKVIRSADQSDDAVFLWIVFMSGSRHTPASLAATVSTLASTSTSTFPGTTGGTGATVGSAGGGASGGAG